MVGTGTHGDGTVGDAVMLACMSAIGGEEADVRDAAAYEVVL